MMLLASPVTSLVKAAISDAVAARAARQSVPEAAAGAPDDAGKPIITLLPPVVRETLGHGLSAARSHAGSAASGLASQAGRAAKASKTAVAAKWAAHRSADDESKAA